MLPPTIIFVTPEGILLLVGGLALLIAIQFLMGFRR